MIRNVVIKKLLVNRLFPFFSLINRVIPKEQNSILIYCANGVLNDNSAALYEHLINYKYIQKYKIIVSGDKTNDKGRKGKKILFVSQIRGIFWFLRCKYVFYSFGKLPIMPTTEQMVVNMWHGIPLKTIGKLSNINNGKEFFFTYICASSELYRSIMAQAFGCSEKNVCICGEPKTDRMFFTKMNVEMPKLIVWTPTFRQSNSLGYNDSTMDSFLPCVSNNEWIELNQAARERNIKLVVKLHGKQNLNGFTEMLYSNLEIFSDACFQKRGMNLYDLLGKSNALLADYSSVYLQYLILDRPIGFVLSDMEEYGNTRGFVFKNPLDYMPGNKIYEKTSLYAFMDEIAQGNDPYREERRRIRDAVHQYPDAQNCARILKIAGISK